MFLKSEAVIILLGKSFLCTGLDRTSGLQEVEVPKISRKSAYVGGKVVNPTHRPSLPQEIPLVLITVRCWVDPRSIVWTEGLSQYKIPVTRSASQLETLRFVAQCLIQLRHRVPRCFRQGPKLFRWILKSLILLMDDFCLRVVYKITTHRIITHVFSEFPGWRAWCRLRLTSVNQTDSMIWHNIHSFIQYSVWRQVQSLL